VKVELALPNFQHQTVQTASTEELTKSKLEMSESLRKQEKECKSLNDYLIGLQTYAETDRQRILEATTRMFTKRENGDNFIQYLNSIDFNINFSKFPFKIIKTVHPDFF